MGVGIIMDKFFHSDNLDIYCGDCVAVLATLHPESVDLTVTSPPYDNLRRYNGYTFDFENIAKQLYRVTKQGGVVVWVVGDATINGSESGTSFKQALFFKEIGFNLHDTMIYYRNSPPLTHNRYEQFFEYMFVFVKGRLITFNAITEDKIYHDKRKHKMFRRNQDDSMDYGYCAPAKDTKIIDNVWSYNVGGGHSTADKIAFEHPAIFPEQLAQDHIVSWSNPGDTVLDPMCGSGTTLKMALLNNRKAIGIDISEDYCALSAVRCLRIQK